MLDTASEQAGGYAKILAPGLEVEIPAGMKKLCRTMENAAKLDRSSTGAG
jgi:hypothetical protein